MGKFELGHKILAYLAEHNDAQDTLEGIMQWWLLEQEIRFQTERVKEALGLLVQKGLIIERKGADARTWYRLDSTKKDEIEALLKGD